MREFTFEIGGGGKIIKRGKSHWPDCVHIKMSRYRAFRIVASIINQLQNDEDEIIITNCGKLEED